VSDLNPDPGFLWMPDSSCMVYLHSLDGAFAGI